MSKAKAESASEFYKKHGDPLHSALLEADARNLQGGKADPVPPAETGSHPHSPAAHVGGEGKPHTKPAGNLRQGSHPGALREPPMVVQRVGKQKRG